MDDQTAIERCRAGDKEAFRHVVERYQAEAIGHAVAILGNREDAMDVGESAEAASRQTRQQHSTAQLF